MKLAFLPLLALLYTSMAWGQNSFKATIKDKETKEPLIGATIQLQGTSKGASADQDAFVEIVDIPNGKQILVCRFLGYAPTIDTIVFPQANGMTKEIFLTKEKEDLEEVIVSATRSSRSISDIPTRIEAISGDELGEKAMMKPGDIRTMLTESTGIQTQQTSATSYNSSIRIQGLDGKYTQVLRDGLPLYGGFSGGLSLLQIVPLDLKQVEVIKGASSTLYGAGAIAGLVNLVSKTPTEKRELSMMLNATSALGLDASLFYSQKRDKIGTTLFASYNYGSPYDPGNDGFTAIPKFKRFTINPKLFFYINDKMSLNFGVNLTNEDRIGGDMKYIKGEKDSIHVYFEQNTTKRISTQMGFEYRFDADSKLSIKASQSFYDRSIELPNYRFAGKQQSSFAEISYTSKLKDHEWLLGANILADGFKQEKEDALNLVDYQQKTIGFFTQDTWNVTNSIVLEGGFRGDFDKDYGFFALPRLSILQKLGKGLSLRLGGGMGYKAPTVFTEDAERIQFRNVQAINVSQSKAERSIGTNLDLNYKTILSDESTLTINTLFFFTQVESPLILKETNTNHYAFEQPDGHLDTRGLETNIKATYGDLKLFVGYTLADVNEHYNGNLTAYPLVSKHRLNNVLMYEKEGKIKIGLEAYYYSPQKLRDGEVGKAYWLCGLMAEKLWRKFSIFINFENILDTRQTRFGSIYTGTISNPTFKDIYAPVDGLVINGGIKIKL